MTGRERREDGRMSKLERRSLAVAALLVIAGIAALVMAVIAGNTLAAIAAGTIAGTACVLLIQVRVSSIWRQAYERQHLDAGDLRVRLAGEIRKHSAPMN